MKKNGSPFWKTAWFFLCASVPLWHFFSEFTILLLCLYAFPVILEIFNRESIYNS